MTSALGLKNCTINRGIKKYKSVIKKNKLLAKTKLNNIEILISKALIESYINRK